MDSCNGNGISYAMSPIAFHWKHTPKHPSTYYFTVVNRQVESCFFDDVVKQWHWNRISVTQQKRYECKIKSLLQWFDGCCMCAYVAENEICWELYLDNSGTRRNVDKTVKYIRGFRKSFAAEIVYFLFQERIFEIYKCS